MKILLPFLVIIGGACSATMLATNVKLKESLQSPVLTVAVAFFIGSLVMLALSATGLLGRGDLSRVKEVPWWAWTGGLLSIVAVIILVFAKSQGNATAFVAAGGVFGQLLMAMLIDHYGWLETEKSPINGWKIAGAVLLLVGALLMGKK
jgi:bacterial/archaeal transporter family-2 protein